MNPYEKASILTVGKDRQPSSLGFLDGNKKP